MSILWAVRHGQANIAGPDYDILSPLGAVQARALGTFMAHPDRRPDAVYSGPRLRQRDTARHLIAGLVDAGAPPPQEAPPLVALDEYPAEAIVRQSLPALKASHPELLAAFSTGAGGGLGGVGDPSRDRRAFEHLFRLSMDRWLSGALAHPEIETFAAFAGRVRTALRQIMAAEGARRRVVVVTSAGPVSIAARSSSLKASRAVARNAGSSHCGSAMSSSMRAHRPLSVMN